jgi:hypothetical protein
MVIDNRAYLDFLCDVFESEELAVNIVILTMPDGPNHLGYGRRQPIGPQRNPTTQRGPKVTPNGRDQVDRKGYVRKSR